MEIENKQITITRKKSDSKVIIFVAPSGSGKSTIISELMEKSNKIKQCISTTTRDPRENEIDGVNYHFISKEEFEKRKQEGKFYETAEAYSNSYAIQKEDINKLLNQGYNVVIDMNLDGLRQFQQNIKKEKLMAIFIEVPEETVEKRLRERGDDQKIINERMKEFKRQRREMEKFHKEEKMKINIFNVKNIDLEKASDECLYIIKNGRKRANQQSTYFRDKIRKEKTYAEVVRGTNE